MKMKKLLAAALAATMMFSSMVTSIVASAETPANAVAVTIAPIAVGAETYTANFDINFDTAVNNPHLLFAVTAEGSTLTEVVANNADEVKIEFEDGGANLPAGKFLVEGKGSDKYVAGVSLTATFELAKAAADGDKITVNVAVTDNADWDENTIVIAAGEDEYTVEAPVAACDHANATLEYDFVDGNCITTKVCPDCDAEPEVIYSAATINVEKGLNLKEGLAVIFRVLVSDISGTDVYAVINHDVYSDDTTISGTSEDMVFTNVTPSTGTKPKYGFTYTGLAAKEMLSEIHVRVYATDANGNVILVGALDFVLVDGLKSYLTKTDTRYVKLGADILRYGAESQKAFGYRPGVLPTEGVDSSCFSELPTTFDNIEVTEGEANVGALERAVVLQNTVSFRFRLTTIDGVAADKLHYTVDFVNSQGAADSATGTVGYNSNGKKYEFTFSSLPVAIVNDYYTVTLWNGETAISTQTFSFQNYAYTQYTTNGNRVDLAQAICAYSASAAALFKTA